MGEAGHDAHNRDDPWDAALREAYGAPMPDFAVGLFDALRSRHTLPPGPVLRGSWAPPRPTHRATGRRTGRYALLGEIARGRTTCVHKAHDHELNRDVALQALQPHRAKSPSAVARFLELAQIRSQLQHPGILPIHDMGFMEGDVPYLVAPLLGGRRALESLAEESVDARLDVAIRVAETIAYAHERGVVHLALRDDAVGHGPHGAVWVLDWGQARQVDEEARPEADVPALHALVRGLVPELPPELQTPRHDAADLAAALVRHQEARQTRAKEAEREAAEARARTQEDAARLSAARVEAERTRAELLARAAARRRDREARAVSMRRMRDAARRTLRRGLLALGVLVVAAGATWTIEAVQAASARRRDEAAAKVRAALDRAGAAVATGDWSLAAQEARSAEWLAEEAPDEVAARATHLASAYAERAAEIEAQREIERRTRRRDDLAFAYTFLPWRAPPGEATAEDVPDEVRETMARAAAGDVEEATTRLHELAARTGDPWVLAAAADLAEREGRLDDAASWWTAAVARRPDATVAWTRLADVELRRHRTERAHDLIRRAEAGDTAPPAVEAYRHAVLGRVLLESGAFPEARKQLEYAASRGVPAALLSLDRARSAAMQAARGGVRAAPPNLGAWMLARQGEFTNAARILVQEEGAGLPPEEVLRTLLRASIDEADAPPEERAVWGKRARAMLADAPLPSPWSLPSLWATRRPSTLARLPEAEADAWRGFWEQHR